MPPTGCLSVTGKQFYPGLLWLVAKQLEKPKIKVELLQVNTSMNVILINNMLNIIIIDNLKIKQYIVALGRFENR